ncbi:MAG: hypothetical protein KDA57_15115 [Planctomycetales bacterium]|nr:hypothetical protein [Planctomycetales bacterium]
MNDRAESITKITAKTLPFLMNAFDKRCRECFLKRDQFLDHVIELETAQLDRQLGDARQSNKARRYVSDSLQRLGPLRTVNWAVRKSTAHALKEVQRRTNLCRDAFFNRLLLLLLLRRKHIEVLGLQTEEFDQDAVGSGPMELIGWSVADPLAQLHLAAQECDCPEVHGALYRMDMSPLDFEFGTAPKGKITPQTVMSHRLSVALSCFIDDAFVPGTEEHDAPSKFTLEELFA